jgi:hypothetical protein
MFVAVPQLALIAMVLGAAIVWAAQDVGRRFGNVGLLCYWLGMSAALSAMVGGWAVATVPATGRPWAYFVIPFCFLIVEIGAVAAALAWSSRSGIRGARQFVIALLVFTVAVVPAVMAARIPDMIDQASKR